MLFAAEPVVIARPQAAVQQAPVQQPVAQETDSATTASWFTWFRCIKT